MHRGGGGFGNRVVRSTNPDVIYGREIEDESVPLETVRSEMEPVCCVGQIMTCDSKQIRNEKHVITFCITDFTDSIHVKIFVPDEYVEDMEKALAPGKFVKVQGTTNLDTFMHELVISSVRGIMKSSDWRTPRSDNAVFKRVELHCHTKMSDMDGVSDVADIIKQAGKYGHRAIAITDHGNVQAFPNAAHAAADAGIQVIYEAMLIFFRKHYGHMSLLLSFPIKAAICLKAAGALLQIQADMVRRSLGFVGRNRRKMPCYVFYGAGSSLEACRDIAASHGLQARCRCQIHATVLSDGVLDLVD